MTISRLLVSAAAHRSVPHANPLSSSQMEALIGQALRANPRSALDIGCGPGAFSIGLAARAPVRVTAIDVNPHFLERARSHARGVPLVGGVEFVERPLREDEGTPFDVVACIGSSGAVGRPRQALRRCKALLAEGGVLVFAEIVWKAAPDAEFLSFLGIDESFYWSAEAGRSVFEAAGLCIIDGCGASPRSWKAYEDAVLAGRLQLAATLDTADAEAVRDRARKWHAMHERHGRVCFGFHAYVARHAEA